MLPSATIDTAVIEQWAAAKIEPGAAEQELLLKGYDEKSITEYLAAYKRLRNSKKQFNGFFYTALGAVLGFISCVLTIINPVPELYNVILFGLTSVAILLICLGLYFLFE